MHKHNWLPGRKKFTPNPRRLVSSAFLLLSLVCTNTFAAQTNIDVMFVYSQAAINKYPGGINAMRGAVKNKLASANRLTFASAGANNYRLNYLASDYVDSGFAANSGISPTSYVKGDKRPYQQYRKNVKADIVVFLVDVPGFGGSASASGIAADAYASIQGTTPDAINWALIHEIGHTMGMLHQSDSPTNVPANYGYRYCVGNLRFRTIMESGHGCGKGLRTTSLQYFSNPKQYHNGVAIGAYGKANNAYHLRANAQRVSKFSDSL